MLTRALSLGIPLLAAMRAFGGTAQDTYEKLWLKHAFDVEDPKAWMKPKATCVCDSGDNDAGLLGVFIREAGVGGACAIPSFDSDGNLTSFKLPYGSHSYISGSRRHLTDRLGALSRRARPARPPGRAPG